MSRYEPLVASDAETTSNNSSCDPSKVADFVRIPCLAAAKCAVSQVSPNESPLNSVFQGFEQWAIIALGVNIVINPSIDGSSAFIEPRV